MPWTPTSAKEHIKGLNRKQRSKWSKIANGILSDCQSNGGKDCEGKAIRIANSKFKEFTLFNPVFNHNVKNKLMQIFGGRGKFLEALKMTNKNLIKKKPKKFIHQKETRPDPQDSHIHVAMLDNNGNGNTNMAGSPSHSHVVKGFIVQPWIGDADNDDDIDFASLHPGSLAYTKTLGKLKVGKMEVVPKKDAAAGDDTQNMQDDGEDIDDDTQDDDTEDMQDTLMDIETEESQEQQDGEDDELLGETEADTSSDNVAGEIGDEEDEELEASGEDDSDDITDVEDNSGLDQDESGNKIEEDGKSESLGPDDRPISMMMPSDVHVPGTGEDEKNMCGCNEMESAEGASMDPSPLDLTDIEEMEIFRIGTHNGEEFSDTDLEEMAANFHALKDEVRPKLKLTHRENQEELGGLASYGDVSDVYVKADELGEKRLYAKLKNVPFEVAKWIQDRRFPERSIELYPEFTLGTGQGGSYRNVLKAVALLGNEMPAVTGMDPVTMLKKYEEQRTICFAEFCACEQEADVYLDKIFSETQAQLDDATKKLENW